MPKMKTHRGAAKRFSLTKSGKVKRAKSNRNHFLRRKSAKSKRAMRQNGLVDSTQQNTVKRLIPYK
ncbi:MAG: 50S ribosomal protein L35 [Firmicutes bacterium]|nr:50S ribosomal protein L35 [Bacillota bacterium]